MISNVNILASSGLGLKVADSLPGFQTVKLYKNIVKRIWLCPLCAAIKDDKKLMSRIQLRFWQQIVSQK